MQVGDRVEHTASGYVGTVTKLFEFFTADIEVKFDRAHEPRTVQKAGLRVIQGDKGDRDEGWQTEQAMSLRQRPEGQKVLLRPAESRRSYGEASTGCAPNRRRSKAP
jgi:hypothetical protein